jgi:hypothetical protein
MRAALAAISDWRCRMLMRRVSTSCACGSGAATRTIRLVAEEHGALGQGLHVAGEAQLRQMIEEARSEASAPPEPVELLGREAQAFEKIERLLEPGSDEEPALGRKLAHEELEHRGPPLPMIQVRVAGP